MAGLCSLEAGGPAPHVQAEAGGMLEVVASLFGLPRRAGRGGCGRYVVEQRLGAGAQAEVFLARGADGLVALKHYDTADPGVGLQQRVAGHPNIARVLDVCVGFAGCAVVEEYVAGTDLLDAVPAGRGLGLARALALFRQLAGAVAHMHARGVAHRDLKLENVLLGSDGTVKLIDFGLAAEWADQRASQRGVGTLYTLPPELAEGAAQGRHVGGADHRLQDSWALGVVLHYLLFGRLPFAQATASDLGYRRFVGRGATCAEWDDCPLQLRLLLCGLLCVDPARRWALGQVERCLLVLRVASVSAGDMPSLVPPSSPPLSGVLTRPLGPRPKRLTE